MGSLGGRGDIKCQSTKAGIYLVFLRTHKYDCGLGEMSEWRVERVGIVEVMGAEIMWCHLDHDKDFDFILSEMRSHWYNLTQ